MDRHLRVVRAATVALLVSSAVMAQPWPSRPVQFIVPAAAGSGPDVTLRAYTDRWRKASGNPSWSSTDPAPKVPLDHRPRPRSRRTDIHSCLASLGQLVANKYTMKTLGYDPDKDFVPVALIGRAPYMVLVNPNLPVRSLADLVKHDRENPGKVSLAYEGSSVLAGSALSQASYGFKSGTGCLQFTASGHSRYNGRHRTGACAGNGHRFVVCDSAQKLRAIAITTDKRLPQLSDVPTVNESYPDFGSFEAWLMIVAPANTPPDVVQRMSAEIARAG